MEPPLALPGVMFVVLVACTGLLVLATWRSHRLQRRLRCPVELADAVVLFRVGADGAPLEVLRCSLLGARSELTCGAACAATAHSDDARANRPA
ncbi:MAG TPA: hypothetical protein VFD84_17825 [Candidatus Binatia bacterium]|nr:hypothetical protein [Candidatus Binatia bacterium]